MSNLEWEDPVNILSILPLKFSSATASRPQIYRFLGSCASRDILNPRPCLHFSRNNRLIIRTFERPTIIRSGKSSAATSRRADVIRSSYEDADAGVKSTRAESKAPCAFGVTWSLARRFVAPRLIYVPHANEFRQYTPNEIQCHISISLMGYE